MPNEITKPFECKYTTFVGGNSSFYEDVGIPLAGALDDNLPSEGIGQFKGDLDEVLLLGRGIQANHALIVGTVGVLLFFASWITKKVLDDVYTAKIQPRIKEVLGQADKKLEGANAKNKKAYELGVWYAKERVLVYVAIVGDSFNDILSQHELIPVVHLNAVNWILQNGRHKSIHLYLVEDGQVNARPFLFDTLAEAKGHIVSKR